MDAGIDAVNLVVMFKYIERRFAGFICDAAVLIEGVNFVADLSVWFAGGAKKIEIDSADDLIRAVF